MRIEKALWKVSNLTNSLPDPDESKIAAYGVKDLEQVIAPNNADMGMIGHLLEDNSIFVAFKGTDMDSNPVKDLITDIDIRLEDFDGYGDVHKGFADAIAEISPDLIYKSVKYLRELPENQPRIVYVTGHSKGGAMASLFGLRLRDALKKEVPDASVVIYTYGSPRVATEEFAANYNVENHAYVAFADAVPHLPFTKEEERVLKRISIFYEKALWFVPMNFKSIGQRHDVIVEHLPYTNVPKYQVNNSGETLCSLVAVERLIRAKDFDTLGDIHNTDYDEI